MQSCCNLPMVAHLSLPLAPPTYARLMYMLPILVQGAGFRYIGLTRRIQRGMSSCLAIFPRHVRGATAAWRATNGTGQARGRGESRGASKKSPGSDHGINRHRLRSARQCLAEGCAPKSPYFHQRSTASRLSRSPPLPCPGLPCSRSGASNSVAASRPASPVRNVERMPLRPRLAPGCCCGPSPRASTARVRGPGPPTPCAASSACRRPHARLCACEDAGCPRPWPVAARGPSLSGTRGPVVPIHACHRRRRSVVAGLS